MGSSFEFNEHALKDLMNEGIGELVAEYEQAMAALTLHLQGRSVEDIKPLLVARWNDMGGEISEPQLTTLATAISEGRKVEFRFDELL